MASRRQKVPEVRSQTSREKAIAQAFIGFCRTIAALRHPRTGCPWDLAQTHHSLRRYMVEEAYEAAEAMTRGSPEPICDELGDVLLQVVLNAQVADDAGHFDVADVIAAIETKMRRRHPHVFGGATLGETDTPENVHGQWNKIKSAEEKNLSSDRGGVFAKARQKFPATAQALQIGKIAAKIRFDWEKPADVLDQLLSEVEELCAEMRPRLPRSAAGKARLSSEIGDVYFTLAQLCRHLGMDPETVSMDANRKFLSRFDEVETLANRRGVDITRASMETKEALWREAKRVKRSKRG
jgi:MazG family protein